MTVASLAEATGPVLRSQRWNPAMNGRWLAALMGLLLLAFGLRVAGLERQSIWVDEGFSVDFASQSASQMTAMWKARGGFGVVSSPEAQRAANDPLAIAVDIHPPLYYLLLHEWMAFAGRGEYAVRFLSVLAGLLLVVLLHKLGAALGGPAVGIAAAAVGTAAPFYVAYSQEARMYAPVALFAGLSLYFTWRLLRSPQPWPWLGLVASSELALYTHYSAVLVLGAENLLVAAVLGWRIAQRRPVVHWAGAWAGAQLLELALFVPWLRTTIGQVAKYNQNLWTPNWRLELTETFRWFDAGAWLPPGEGLQLAAATSAVLLGGIAAAIAWNLRRRTEEGRPYRAALLFGGGALLLELALALIAFQIRPEFSPRYLIVLATPYYLLLGLALAALWRRLPPAGLLASAGMAAIFAVGLRGYEFDPNFAKDDTRTLAQYLAGHTTASDVIVLDAPEPLGYYYHGPATLVSIPGDESTVAQALTTNAAGKQRVVFVQWFVSTSDPEQLVPFLLQKYGRLVDDKGFRGYRERTYAIPPDARFELSPTDHPEDANFAGTLRLTGAGFGPSAAGDSQLLDKIAQPVAVSGGQALLALSWQLLKPVAKDYKATVYLTDSHGHLAGQQDLLLRHNQATTSRWPAGTQATNYYVLDTLPGIMPGAYTLHVAVYPDGQQERLSVLDAAGAPGGGSATIGSLQILRPTTPAAPSGDAGVPVAQGISLVGHQLAQASVAQGDPLHVTLYWRATAQPPADLEATLQLVRADDNSVAWQASSPPPFPTAQWRPGDQFRDWYDPVLPPTLAAGTYQLLASMGGLRAPIGQVQVLERSRSFAAPTPQHALHATLGSGIELLGYDQDKASYAPGSTAKLTLYWRSREPVTDSFTAFVHLLDGGRHVAAQMDTVPDHGQAPTNAWLPGEVVADAYELPLRTDLAPGSYQIETGFYRGDTGVRLKAASPDVQAIDDGLLIGTLTVTK